MDLTAKTSLPIFKWLDRLQPLLSSEGETMRPWLITTFAALMTIALATYAATPEETFDKLYGEQMKRTASLRDPKATEEFAQGLIKDAAELKDDPKLQAVVFAKAFEIAMRGGLYPAAGNAMEKLAIAQPALKREADEKQLLALERDQRPVARARLEVTRARVVAVKRLEQLEKAMQKSPNKKDAAELVRLLMIELDDPAKAMDHVQAAQDETLKRIVGLGNTNATELSEQDAKDLGDWYQARSAAASVSGRTIALGRAKGCYEQFLAVHAVSDASRLDVKRKLEAIAKAEVQSGSISGQWIDLLAMVDLKKDTKAGTWKLENGVLTSDAENGARIQIRYLPPEEYDFRIVFSRNEGTSGVLQYATRKEREMIWAIGYSDLFSLNEKNVDQKSKLQNGRKYTSLIKVRRDGVQFFLDNQSILEEKDDDRLAQHELWNRLSNEKLLGVGSFFSPTSFYSIEIHEVSGKGKPFSEK